MELHAATEVDFQSHCVATQMEVSSEDLNYMEESLDRSLRFVGVHVNVLTKAFMELDSSKVPDVI